MEHWSDGRSQEESRRPALLHPRLILWAFLAALAVIVSRLAFAAVEMIPHHLDFDPGVSLVPLAGVFLGASGAWGVGLGSLAADRLLGLSGWEVVLRALALFLFALGTRRLWDVSLRPDAATAVPAASWGHTLRFLFASWPGCLVASAWGALASELARVYPFAYVVSLLALHHVLFCTLLGLPLYRAMAMLRLPVSGWSPGPTRPGAAALIVAGSVGACVAGLLVSRTFYGIGPLEPFVIGTGTGWGVTAAVIPFLVLQAVGLFRRYRPISSTSSPVP